MITKKITRPLPAKSSGWNYLKKNYGLYLMLIPGALLIIVFRYLPLSGLLIAFKDYNIFAGDSLLSSIMESPWVGLDNFKRIFASADFVQVLKNTLIISFYKLIFTFPLPIILALMLNELRSIVYKKTLQTVLYLPHFLSWAVVSTMMISILGSGSFISTVLEQILGHKLSFFTDTSLFRGLLVTTEAWKTVGWNSILYLAAITGIDQQLYEAAEVDGVGKLKSTIYVTLPGISSTIIMLFILRVGKILEAGFEQILVMYNPTVYEVSDIIDTYVFRMGLGQMDFTLGTTVGLFNSIVSFILVLGANTLSRKLTEKSIW